PLAEAIVAGAAHRGIDLSAAEDFEAVTGQGVRGRVEGHAVALGNAALMRSLGAGTAAMADEADRLRGEGRTVMLVAIDGTFGGLIAVADPVKESAPAAIRALRAEGLRIVMATGDNARTAATVA